MGGGGGGEGGGGDNPTYSRKSAWHCCLRWRVTLRVLLRVRLCVEIEWEICHVDLSLPSKSMADIAPQI